MSTTRPLADRLVSAVARCDDLEALAAALWTVLIRDVPFDFGCLAPTDPATGLITGAYKSHPLEVGDQEFAAAEYGEPDVNRFAEIAGRTEPVGVLSLDTGGRPELCRRFREFMAPQFGFTDELRLCCRAQGITWGALALYRGAGEPAFTAADARIALSIVDVLAQAIRDVLFGTKTGGDATGQGPAVIIIDHGDTVKNLSSSARQRIDDLGGWDNGQLPASLLAVAATARSSPDLAATHALGRSGNWLNLRASRLDEPADHPDVVVTVDTAHRGELSRLTLAARGLTSRELDVAALVLQGASTKAIAATLFLSPHTVQDHLKAIFGKLGVNSRREMIGNLISA